MKFRLLTSLSTLIFLLFFFAANSLAGVRSVYDSHVAAQEGEIEDSIAKERRRDTFVDYCSVSCTFVNCLEGGSWKDHVCMDDKMLYFSPAVTTFVRDAEYFLPYTKGYTALGFFMKPTFTYKHNDHLSVSAGVDLMGIAGDHKKIRGVSPIVTISYSPIKNITIVGGTLRNLGHCLDEPMWDYDRNFYAHKEDGLQVFAHTEHWKTEMWCNWEDFIVVDSPWQEKFTFGWRNDFYSNSFGDFHNRIKIPVNLMMNHRGGQIDAVEDTCIETLANVSIAIEYSCRANGITYTAGIPFYGFSNRSNEEHIHTHFKDGWGIYPNIDISGVKRGRSHNNSNYIFGRLGYWYGDGFISGRGSYLFQSRSYFDEEFERRYRHMITAIAGYYLNEIFSIQLRAYYDIDEKSMDYSATISMWFDKNFKIYTFKNK